MAFPNLSYISQINTAPQGLPRTAIESLLEWIGKDNCARKLHFKPEILMTASEHKGYEWYK